MKLYDDQVDFVEDIRNAFRTHQSVLAQAATGFGKTVVASYIAKAAAAKGKRVYSTVHRKNLITQTQRTFFDWGIPHGVIAAGHSAMPHEQMQIASIQSLVRRLDTVAGCDLVIVDECHLACSPTWSKVLDHFKRGGARLLGNTATPARLDNKPLSEHFDVIVSGPTVRSLIDAGRLSDYRIYAPSVVDLGEVHTRMGDYVTSELEDVMDTSLVTGDAVTHYQRLMPGKRALGFCVSIRHSQHVAEQFCAAGIPARHIDGETSDADRLRAIKDFANGKIFVLTNVDLITTGFDLSSQIGREVPVEGAIMLRPTMSLVLWLQMLGRVMRRKDYPAIIADHTNGTLRHGFPDDVRDWTLDGAPSRNGTEESAPALRHCEECFAIYRAILGACPLCGWEPVVEAKMPEEADGELTEIDQDEFRARIERVREERTALGLEALVKLAVERDYKPGWAARRHHYRNKKYLTLDQCRADEREIRREL